MSLSLQRIVKEPAMYDTVIFDLDGTLLDTLEDLRVSTNYALKRHGFPSRTLKEVRRFVGNGVRRLIERAMPEGASQEAFEAVFADFKAHYQIHCNDSTRPYDGIIPLLRELKRRGCKTGIASNKIKSAVLKLDEIYFEGLIDMAAGVSDGILPKPAPEMVLDLLARLGSAKEHTLYVGDSEVDVQTAANAGLDFTAVLWGFRDKEELLEAGAKGFIERPAELLEYL
ncbi:MAG: HAD family hydrolase [Butyrivibrio sp.]|nr:HAD family hydrolase [Butyrivibrio sp.]